MCGVNHSVWSTSSVVVLRPTGRFRLPIAKATLNTVEGSAHGADPSDVFPERPLVLAVVSLEHIGRDAAAVGNLHVALARPLPDGLVLLAVDRRPAARRTAGTATAPAAQSAGRADEIRKRFP